MASISGVFTGIGAIVGVGEVAMALGSVLASREVSTARPDGTVWPQAIKHNTSRHPSTSTTLSLISASLTIDLDGLVFLPDAEAGPFIDSPPIKVLFLSLS